MSGQRVMATDGSGRRAEVLFDDGKQVVLLIQPYGEGESYCEGGEARISYLEFRAGWRADVGS